jgi:hypothetical protein
MERIRENYVIPEVLMQPLPQPAPATPEFIRQPPSTPPPESVSTPSVVEEERRLDDTMARLKISSSSDFAPSIKEDEKRMPTTTSSSSLPSGFEDKFGKAIRLTSIPESPFPPTPMPTSSTTEDDDVFNATTHMEQSFRDKMQNLPREPVIPPKQSGIK